VANKGGVREEGTVGWLLAMAQERGGGPVRRSRGAKDGGARRACPREEDEGGAYTSPREEREGRVGQPKATGPASRWAGAGERGGGPRLGQKSKMGQS
jgi:hypothetical protein